MQINSTNNNTNFKALEKLETPALKNVIEKELPEVKTVIENAEKELADKRSRLVITTAGENFLTHFVDMGDEGLTFIDSAVKEGKNLKVAGYTYDYKTGNAMKHTKYVWYDIPLRSEKQAKIFEQAINNTPYSEINSKAISRACEVAKALDKMA